MEIKPIRSDTSIIYSQQNAIKYFIDENNLLKKELKKYKKITGVSSSLNSSTNLKQVLFINIKYIYVYLFL